MRSIVFLLAFALHFPIGAQRTISGTFSPAKDYTWLIAYHMQPGVQNYVADGPIKAGKFTLNLPENSPVGTYRVVYAIPQEEYHFDVLYTGKEDVVLTFDSDTGVTFTASEENIVFSTYFKEIHKAEQQLITYYTKGTEDKRAFRTLIQDYRRVQDAFMEKSAQLKAHEFIKANRPYIPDEKETPEQYMTNRKTHYFDALDVTNTTLQASGFLTGKLSNYVFTALPPRPMDLAMKETLMIENLNTVVQKLHDVSQVYRFSLLHTIWSEASLLNFPLLSEHIYDKHLKLLASTPGQQETIAAIELRNRLRPGAVAPEIVWKNAGEPRSLSTLDGYGNYVLVFWSSTCDHCLRELPELHKRLQGRSDLKVLAIGLEDDDRTWKLESAKLNAFEHAIALGKWESEYAQTYGINSTPTYFILDKEKRIVSKPESDKDVVDFFENRNK